MSERFVLNETSIFGRGCRSELPGEIKGRGYKKVFLVTDKGLVNCGLIKKVTDVLDEAKIDYTLYSEVKPNPSIKNALDGYGICKKIKADVIVAVGGGSAIDTAKCIAILMKNPDRADVKSLNGLSNTKNKGLPMIALPTTHGTAAEVTINYVITDEDAQVKMVCVDPHDIPLLAIVDSELMESLPKMTAAATGLDALTHAVEGYITKAHNTMSDMFHMRAIELIFENLPAAVNEKNKKAIESAFNKRRPKFNEVLDLIQQVKTAPVALVLSEANRLARNFNHISVLDDLVKTGKVEIHFVKEGMVITPFSTANDVYDYRMLIAEAERFSAELSNMTKKAMQTMRENGFYPGKAPIGYKNCRPSWCPWILPDEQAGKVQFLFDNYLRSEISIKNLLEVAQSSGDVT